MYATAHCPECPGRPSTLERITPDLAVAWRWIVAAATQLTRPPATKPHRASRATTLTMFNQRLLDDINAPDGLYQELAHRQATAQLDELHTRAGSAHWL